MDLDIAGCVPEAVVIVHMSEAAFPELALNRVGTGDHQNFPQTKKV